MECFEVDYILEKLNGFIAEVNEYKVNSYTLQNKDKLLLAFYPWNKDKDFYELIYNIGIFIKNEDILNIEYCHRVNLFHNIQVNTVLQEHQDKLYGIIVKFWAFVKAKNGSIDNNFEISKQRIIDSIKDEPARNREILSKTVPRGINALFDEKSYKFIYKSNYIKDEIKRILGQYSYACLPSYDDFENDYLYDDYMGVYSELLNSFEMFLAKELLEKNAHEFSLFNKIFNVYKEFKLYESNDENERLDVDYLNAGFEDIVNSTICVLSATKDYYLKISSSDIPNPLVSTEVKILYYDTANRVIKINNVERKLEQALFDTFEFFVNGDNQSFETLKIAEKESIAPNTLNKRITRLKDAAPELKKYIKNERIEKNIGKYSLTIKCQNITSL